MEWVGALLGEDAQHGDGDDQPGVLAYQIQFVEVHLVPKIVEF